MAVVGTTLNLSDGTWDLQDTLEKRYLRNGVAIPGETGNTYVTVLADADTSIRGEVRASVSGGSFSDWVPSNTINITHVAPTVTGSIAAQTFLENDGVKTVDGAVFSGLSLVYTLSSTTTGVTINAGTGLVSINTNLTGTLSAVNITVVATNSGGSVEVTFPLTVSVDLTPPLTTNVSNVDNAVSFDGDDPESPTLDVFYGFYTAGAVATSAEDLAAGTGTGFQSGGSFLDQAAGSYARTLPTPAETQDLRWVLRNEVGLYGTVQSTEITIGSTPVSYLQTAITGINNIQSSWVSDRYTFSGLSIPNPASGRYVEAKVVTHGDPSDIVNVRANGALMTEAINLSSSAGNIGIWYVLLESGTTVDIEIEGSTGVAATSAGVIVSEVDRAPSSTITPDTDNDTTRATLNLDLAGTVVGDVISAAAIANNGDPWTWTQITEDAETDIRTNEWFSGASGPATAGTTAVTATSVAPINTGAVAIVYEV